MYPLYRNKKHFSKILLIVYLFLLGISTFHYHTAQQDKSFGYSFTTKGANNYTDPLLDELGNCRIAQLFSSSFQNKTTTQNFSLDFPVINILKPAHTEAAPTGIYLSLTTPRAPPTFS